MDKETGLKLGAWLLGGVVIGVAFTAWAQVRLSGSALTFYDFFPLLGLIAFSLMWTHFITGAIRKLSGAAPNTLHDYFIITSAIVLGLILLHPGILIIKLWFDGFGLPPLSYLTAYGSDDGIRIMALLLGTVSLLVFLLFELRRKFGKASWWKYVLYLNMAAMAAIYIHALLLGGELALPWFKIIWYFYGVTLVVAAAYRFGKKRRVHE